MKSLSLVLVLAVSVLMGCDKKSNDAAGANAVAVSVPQECAGPQSGFGEYYNDFEAVGCSAYGWDHGRFRHQGCPSGTFAACGNGVGMICVPGDIYRERNVAWFNYADGNSSMPFCGYEGASNKGPCSYRSVAGAGKIGRACIVGRIGECGPGVCAPIGRARSVNRDRDDRRAWDRDRDRDDRRDARRDRDRRRHDNVEVGVCVQ